MIYTQTLVVLSALFLVMPGCLAQVAYRYLDLAPDVRQYEVRVGNTQVGHATWILSRVDSGDGRLWRFQWQLQGMFNQESRVLFRQEPFLTPLVSEFESQRGKLHTRVRVNYSDSLARGTLSDAGRSDKVQAFTAPMAPGLVDIGLLPLVVSHLPLQVGSPVDFPLLDVRKGRLVRGRGFVSRVVDVDVPAGRFRCYRLELFAGMAREVDFIEVRPPHRLVRQLYPAVDVEVRLLK